ncbi:histidine ammonia-lyase [Mesotoga sp. BH458_6_3_2_1]|uniref:histidine ammonia-lyase n=1 Tax=Mesotoga sp. BH458_6_3_2_1 TaxID=1437446 RepID=UPI000EF1EC89|nr:histidine ammonia-lyase [Mesotoga sp. BH458_6_3_2_1]RLL86434.1 histidine ammonia-lyase [Mesotoga sp. BH458_6_3_2_1]
MQIDGEHLRLSDIFGVAFENEPCSIEETAAGLLDERRRSLEIISKEKTIYGVNTGFGILADHRISPDDVNALQKNIVLSHAAGVGEPVQRELVRAIMLVRANSLLKGYSGVRKCVVQRILDLLNNGITPMVPEKGSVGASGDLAPLAHIAMTLIGEGECFFDGKVVSSSQALERAKLQPLVLKSKEGLSLLNGTAFMAGIGACATHTATQLFEQAILVAAMSVDALMGSTSPFDARVQQARRHPGQSYVARRLRETLEGSEIRTSHLDCDRVQDAYTLRTIPQVYGAVKDTIDYVGSVLNIEVNSATDNPLIFENGDAISGGNFHGEPVALAVDFLSIALTDMGNMIERRIDRLVNPKLNDLPAFLTNGEEGLNSGYMLWQYTAAALASENKTLAHPASADSIPTSGFQEDHVSMGAWGARKLWKIVDNVATLISIEALLAFRALSFRHPKRSSAVIEGLFKDIEEIVPDHKEDRYFGKEFSDVRRLLFRKAGLSNL